MISLVWAQAANGVIGKDGTLPWRIPEDMRRFRALTSGATVVMGRRTWESLPARFRPLPGRVNVVVTRDPSYAAEGARVVASMDEALRAGADIWVAGGSAIYAAALPGADRVFLTEVDGDWDGDVLAPAIGPEWVEVARDPADGWHTSETGVRYRFRDLERQRE